MIFSLTGYLAKTKISINNSNPKNKLTMSEFQINNPSQSDDSNKPQNFRIALNKLSQREIINIFDSINSEGRNIIIPIGFPKAGKSLFLSSLMYYSQRFTNKHWTPEYLTAYPFDNGNLSRNQMVTYFDNKEAYPATTSGTIDLIGVNVIPNKKSIPTLKLAFVDLAGEDIEKIKTSNMGGFDAKLEGILKGCELGKPIFCLITPFQPSKGERQEDQLHFDFMNYIKVNLPNLYNVSKFIIIVSQWDKIPKQTKVDVETYIKDERPSLHGLISGRNAKIVYGEYSVGELTNTFDDDNNNVVLLRRIDFQYPHNFWNNLYKVSTGKYFEGSSLTTFFKKLFG
jgi:hypothetical protein